MNIAQVVAAAMAASGITPVTSRRFEGRLADDRNVASAAQIAERLEAAKAKRQRKATKRTRDADRMKRRPVITSDLHHYSDIEVRVCGQQIHFSGSP